MHSFSVTDYKKFSELPLETFESRKFSVYILDFNWCYLFVNAFVIQNLDVREEDLIGNNMWEVFPSLRADPFFADFKTPMEKTGSFNGISISPLTKQKLSVTGYALEDCYYCTSSILLNKDDLISDLRKQMSRKS